MALFDDVTDEYHECGVDNLYVSAKFCRDTYNHTKKTAWRHSQVWERITYIYYARGIT